MMSTKVQVPTKAAPTSSFTPAPTGLLQRKCACGGKGGLDGECAECRQKRLTTQPNSPGQAAPTATSASFGHDFGRVRVNEDAPQIIQTKLKVNEPGDKFEQEADRVADQVMRMPEPGVSAQPGLFSQTNRIGIQRLCPECEEELHRQPIEEEEEEEEELLQAKPDSSRTPKVTPQVQGQINAMRGGGQPLDPSTRQFMESRFGHDFSQVRVHTDTRAAQSALALNALAYTVGHNVVFAAGLSSTQTVAGKKLLAHELTHVVQQSSGAAKATGLAGRIQRKPEKKGVVDRILLGEDLRTHLEPGTHLRNVKAIVSAFHGVADYFKNEGWKLDNATFNRSISRDVRVLLSIASFHGPPRSQRSLDNQVVVLQKVFTVAGTLIRQKLNNQPDLSVKLVSAFKEALQSLRASVRKIGAPDESLEKLDETISLTSPSLTLTPGNTLTRGNSLTATVSFTPTAGERINVTSWEYITPSQGTFSRPTTDTNFQTRWAGNMALSGTIRLQWHYVPPGTVVETLEQPITVNNRTGAPWESTVIENAERARAGMPSPPRQFSQLGVHEPHVTDPTTTDSKVNGGPNHDFTFVSTLTAGTYTSSPQIHPDVINARSAFLRFHSAGSVLFRVAAATGAKTRIPVGEYNSFVQNPLSWNVPDWEAFFKRHGIFTVTATAGGTTRTVANANWGLVSNAQRANVRITNEAAVRTQLGITSSDSFSFSSTVNFGWEGHALMFPAEIQAGVRSHEYVHGTHSHRANFLKMMRALDPQKVIERTVSTPYNTIDFATKLVELRTQILAPNHEIVDEVESARQEIFVAMAGETMAGITTDPATGEFLGNIWNINGSAPMT